MSKFEIRPTEVRVFRNASSSDLRQVPATGASLAITRQGATVTEDVTCPAGGPSDVSVSSTGRLLAGDAVLLNNDASRGFLKVHAVDPSGGMVSLLNTASQPGPSIGVLALDRLIVAARVVVATAVTLPAHSLTSNISLGSDFPLQVGQWGFAKDDPTKPVAVVEVDEIEGTVTLSNQTASAIYLAASDTIVLALMSTVPTYLDSTATIPADAPPVLDATGGAEFYSTENRLDCIVWGGGLSAPRLRIDLLGGRSRGSIDLVNAADYPSIQDAIDACPVGGRVYVPGGTWRAPDGGLKITKSLEFTGDGPASTFIEPYDGSQSGQPVLVIDTSQGTVAYLTIRGMRLWNEAEPATRHLGSHGISCITTADTGATELRIENVLALNLGDDGFHFEGANIGAGAVVFLYGVGMEATDCRGSGFFIRFATAVQMNNCFGNGNDLFGAFCDSAAVAWYMSAFENNCKYPSQTWAKPSDEVGIYSDTWGAQLRLRSCAPGRVDACNVENFTYLDPYASSTVRYAPTAIVLEDSQGALVSNCTISGTEYPMTGAGAHAIAGIGIFIDTPGGATILPNHFGDVATPVFLTTGALPAHCIPTSVFPQRILNGASVVPGPTVGLNLQGITVPSLTTDELRTVNVPDGQLIFDAQTKVLRVSVNGTWLTIATVSGS